jgi:hypothetical protein
MLPLLTGLVRPTEASSTSLGNAVDQFRHREVSHRSMTTGYRIGTL